MTTLLPDVVDSDFPIGVLEVLRGTRGASLLSGHPRYAEAVAATAYVTGFFGPSIRLHDEDDEPGDTPLPYCAVLWGGGIPSPGHVGAEVVTTGRVDIEIRLPHQAQRLPSIALPAAPSVSAVAGGTTIAAGTYLCGYTAYTTAGESYGGPVSSVTLSAGQQIRFSSIPSGVRIWRTPVNRRDCRYLTIPAAATHDDDTADSYLGDALFPERGLARKLVGAINKVLNCTLYIPDATNSSQITDAAVIFGAPRIATDRARNIKRIRWSAEWPMAYDAYSREAE